MIRHAWLWWPSLTWAFAAVEEGWLGKGDEGRTRNAVGTTVDSVWQYVDDFKQLQICMREWHIVYCITYSAIFRYCHSSHYNFTYMLAGMFRHRDVCNQVCAHAWTRPLQMDNHSPTHPLESNLSLGKMRGKREYWHFSCMPRSDLPNWVMETA